MSAPEKLPSLNPGLTLDGYQHWAREFATHQVGTVYPALALNGEAGEAAEVIKKALRKDGSNTLDPHLTQEDVQSYVLELGDVLYYLARCAESVGYSLGDVANFNQVKLERRSIHGKRTG